MMIIEVMVCEIPSGMKKSYANSILRVFMFDRMKGKPDEVGG